MQAKRIISLLVVVVLTILCGVMSVSAQDNAINFEYAVEVNSSTAIVEEPGLHVKPGDTVEVSVTVTANPGIKMMKFSVVYDSAALTPVVDAENNIAFTSGGMFVGFAENVYVDSNNPNKIIYVVDATAAEADITATGTVITLQFKVAEGFHGDTGIKLDNYKKNVGGGTIPGTSFDSVTAKDASVEGYNKASISTHNYGAPVVADATCTTPATTTYTCTIEGCQDSVLVIENAPALGHTPVVDAAKDPTCTESGLTEGSHCSVCNEVLVAQNSIPALGHTPVVDGAVEPTYSEEGKTEGTHCSVCGSVLTAQEIVPQKSSLWIWLVAIAGVAVVGAGGFCAYWFGIKKKGAKKEKAPKEKAPKETNKK